MNRHSCRTYFSIACDDNNRAAVKNYLTEITDELIESGRGFIIGLNEDYDVDVNVMLRLTLKSLFGKEDKIKFLYEAFGAATTLEVVPYISDTCENPQQILSIDKDIIEFLYKSGATYDLDYYIV